MVEVIKKGKVNEYDIQCHECNSILRYTHMDEKEIKYIDSKSTVITCPVCGKDVITGSFDSLHYCYYGKLVEEDN